MGLHVDLQVIRRAGEIRHPNLAVIHDLFEEENRLCCALEWMDGSPLRDLEMSGTAVEPDRLLAIGRGLCSALEAAHRSGVIHGALNPESVLLASDGEVKLAGLGENEAEVATARQDAFQAGAVLSMLPAILLSGFIFPIRSMPAVLQWITYAVPARYYLVILRGIILKGAGLADYPRQMLFLTIYAIVVLAIAALRLRRRET